MHGLPESGDPRNFRMPTYPGDFTWLNNNGQQSLDCGISGNLSSSEELSSKIPFFHLTASLYDGIYGAKASASKAACSSPAPCLT